MIKIQIIQNYKKPILTRIIHRWLQKKRKKKIYLSTRIQRSLPAINENWIEAFDCEQSNRQLGVVPWEEEEKKPGNFS